LPLLTQAVGLGIGVGENNAVGDMVTKGHYRRLFTEADEPQCYE
jgi:hypothetical protein